MMVGKITSKVVFENHSKFGFVMMILNCYVGGYEKKYVVNCAYN